jgi:CheY-like chemotaxis protein
MTTWMLVEDEPGLYDMVLAMYDILGVQGVAFLTGEEAFAWIDEVDRGGIRGELPELAMLDIRLPNRISGPDVGARLRNSPVLYNIGIVLMTAYKMSPHEERAASLHAGADLFLYKPLPRYPELEKMLRQVIASRANGR